MPTLLLVNSFFNLDLVGRNFCYAEQSEVHNRIFFFIFIFFLSRQYLDDLLRDNHICNMRQENYINYRPSLVSKDDNDLKRTKLIARAAESIADGDIVNVQIRRYQQWQLSQASSLTSSIIPYVAYLCSGKMTRFSHHFSSI